ncbi:endonuclease/exonuclease/phosphatase family protein [Rubrivirga sp.]|uniref:endonuclease/exonuclease/phosphatase family protein n=1 Tax=Rubrivirga sp. TaxID=1885344 RepID=UPI003B5263DC
MLPRFTALFLFASAALAQPIITPRGGDATFDVATWNIEQFGDPSPSTPPDQRQIHNAEAILSQAEIDLWAVQEVKTQEVWDDLLGRLRDDGYAGRLGTEPTFGDLKAGFIYDSTVVSVIGTGTPLPVTGSFGGKQPFELHAQVTVGGETRTVRVIALHAKNGNSENDHFNRTQGALKLKAYIDERIAEGESVILLGDFNDFLTRGRWRGATGSPYAPFVEDADYVAATVALENAGIPTICGGDPACFGGTTIDHILYTSNFPAQLVEVARYDEALTEVENFFVTTSDHAPVLVRFDLAAPVVCDCTEPPPVRLLPPAPHPFRGPTDLRFALRAASDVRLEVFDVLGRSVVEVEGSFGAGDHAVALDGAVLAPGAYVVRLTAGEAVRSSVIVRAD